MNIELMKQSLYACKKRAYEAHIRKLREKYYNVNERLQKIRVSNRKLNCLRWYNGESREHILKKLEICIVLKNKGHKFLTEAIFENGSRADIVDLTDGVVYEVLCSESEEDCDIKIEKYPEEFEVIKIKC